MHAITLSTPGTLLPESELVLNADGSVYHLALRPEQLGDLVLICGDPGRVKLISDRFEKIEHRVENRECVTHAGEFRGTHVTALATGIGTDNIDIVLNELDALANIDLEKREPRAKTRSLRIIRLGTCGAMQPDIPVDSLVVSAFGIGLDNVLHYYAYEHTPAEQRLLPAFLDQTEWPDNLPIPYVAEGDPQMIDMLHSGNTVGITLTAGGFYGPQGRRLRAIPSVDDLNERFTAFSHDGLRITNFEMETSALYGLSGMLGHRAVTICAVVANRLRQEYTRDHRPAIQRMIDQVLDLATA